MKISAAVFDFGGVMTSCATPVRVKEIVDAAGLPWNAVTDGFAKYRRDYDIGEITVAEFYDRLWRDAGVEVSAAVRAAIEEADTASFLHPNAGTLDFMRSLKERGFKIGILTNMPRELAPRFRERFAGTVALTDALVVSCEVRLVKPMREIYDLMAQTLAVPGGEICFFDDAPVNCRGARDAGWHSICFTSISEAASEFEKLAESVCARQRRGCSGRNGLLEYATVVQ